MNSRIGIELSPASCRILEVTDAPGSDDRPRVLASDVLAASGPETRARLAALGGRSAGVVIWNARNDHRQVMVPVGPYESMRAEALRSLSAAGVRTHGMWTDIGARRSSAQSARWTAPAARHRHARSRRRDEERARAAD
jgi:hypothetical protein